MSAVKEKTKDSSVKKGPATTENKYTVKKKRKQWMKEKFKSIKPQPQKQEKAKVQQVAPPKDGLQFSANWKALQEVCHLNDLSLTCYHVSYLFNRFNHIQFTEV